MCDCSEIQGGRNATEMDWDWSDYYYKDGFVGRYDPHENFRILPAIWLPDQSQLQEMIEDEPRGQLFRLYHFALENDNIIELRNVFQFTSMEQLWLAFVMKELHNKTWNGDKWE